MIQNSLLLIINYFFSQMKIVLDMHFLVSRLVSLLYFILILSCFKWSTISCAYPWEFHFLLTWCTRKVLREILETNLTAKAIIIQYPLRFFLWSWDTFVVKKKTINTYFKTNLQFDVPFRKGRYTSINYFLNPLDVTLSKWPCVLTVAARKCWSLITN